MELTSFVYRWTVLTGAKFRQVFKHFNSVAEAAQYLKEERNCSIVGIEIMDNAVPITSQPFTENTAFMFGNEGMTLINHNNIVTLFIMIFQSAPYSMSVMK
jgi:tRNA G18 (ribose-2'-O)-methylase SpoU